MRKIPIADALIKARAFEKSGNKEQAIKLYKLVLEKSPSNNTARKQLLSLQKANLSTLEPSSSEAEFGLLVNLYNQGKYNDVVIGSIEMTKSHPKNFKVWNLLGSAYNSLNDNQRASTAFREVIKLDPHYSDGYNNLGVTLKNQGRHREAIKNFKKALKLNKSYVEAYYNLGNTFSELRQFSDAISSYEKVISLHPNHVRTFNNWGIVLNETGRSGEAIKIFEQAISIDPNYAEAHYNLANSYARKNQFCDAINFYQKSLDIKLDYESARIQLLHQQACICDWNSIQKNRNLIEKLGISQHGVMPFPLLSLEDAPYRHRLRAENFAKRKLSQQALPMEVKEAPTLKRIRIGYFSSDFYNHATMYLMIKLFEIHNRNKFEVFAYSFGPNKKDDMRLRVEKAVDVFKDVRNLSDLDIALLARRDKIDIAIDLKGYTDDSRPGIFAHRVSPVQVSYLGYPGTMGAKFIDYIIADKIVIPESSQKFFSEEIIYLPNSYQVNDNSREISESSICKSDVGLPERGFVFCCFNNNYKITATEFDIWMRLLDKIEGSVLWLLKSNLLAEKNLKKAAERRGIDSSRLVFAEKIQHAEHLARHRLADLFLDTFNYNAHTTASDALWAGLPIVTKLGESFSSRVAASLLNAVGVPELITDSIEEYEKLAYKLATDSHYLKAFQYKLSSAAYSKPLFDTERFVRHLEVCYMEVYRRYHDGNQLQTICVEDSA